MLCSWAAQLWSAWRLELHRSSMGWQWGCGAAFPRASCLTSIIKLWAAGGRYQSHVQPPRFCGSDWIKNPNLQPAQGSTCCAQPYPPEDHQVCPRIDIARDRDCLDWTSPGFGEPIARAGRDRPNSAKIPIQRRWSRLTGLRKAFLAR